MIQYHQSIIKEDAPPLDAGDYRMITKLTKPTLIAALRMGGFIGWSLAIMYICQQNLRYYRDDSLLLSVNTTFLTAGAITGAILVVVLLLIDFDGLLNDRLFKWLPGVVMAETGIALSLSNVDTMTAFAAIAGVASALGALAVLSHLIQIKVGQRMLAIGFALAIGGGIRLLTAAVAGQASRTGLVIVSVAVGIFAALTVHSRGSSDDHGGLLIGLAEASPRTIISKVPYVYIILPILAGAFWLAHSHISSVAQGKLPAGYEGYETTAYLGFVLAALVAALFVKLPRLALLFAVGTGIAAAAGMLAGLPYMTNQEAGMFALMSFGSLACIRACIYLFIIVFSMDRPHPLFYAMFGYTVSVIAELAGTWLDSRIDRLDSWPLIAYIAILVALMPIGGGLLHLGMRKYGYTQEKLDHRKVVRNLIRKRSSELGFSEREEYMLESVVLDGSGIDELAGHLLFSHNTIKVLLRPVCKKLGAEDLEQVREHFFAAAESEEQFLALVHAAEDEKRAADKAKARQERREQREQERRERERQNQEEMERKLLEMQTMEQVLGIEHAEETAAEDPSLPENEPADPENDAPQAADEDAASDPEADEAENTDQSEQGDAPDEDRDDISGEDEDACEDGGTDNQTEDSKADSQDSPDEDSEAPDQSGE